jgi:cardiolipin synthase
MAWLNEAIAVVSAVIHFAAAVAVSCHAVLTKDDPRAAVGWVGLAWLAPFVGSAIYGLFGINRVSRRGARLGRKRHTWEVSAPSLTFDPDSADVDDVERSAMRALTTLGRSVTNRPLLRGNSIEPLVNGDQAYPAMVEAIDGATQTVALCSYIFRPDAAGRRFVDALAAACGRGVDVRVLVDGIGAGYLWSPLLTKLEAAGVPAARFLHSFVPWRMPYVNMRTHRKVLVVDGRTGFTGGMNIARANLQSSSPRRPINDIHFRVTGPVVSQLMAAFAEDWHFTTGEELSDPGWFPDPVESGHTAARAIPSGPDEDLEKLLWVLAGAIERAQHRVRIVTPYFLPDQRLIASLALAAMRGVAVDIVLPARSNHFFMDWAAFAQHEQLLRPGCRIHLSPRPFDHSKLMTVDGRWALIGSANWDARSLRLNFEHNVECYDNALAAQLDGLIDAKIADAASLSLEAVTGRNPLRKLRDGFTRLLTPYL